MDAEVVYLHGHDPHVAREKQIQLIADKLGQLLYKGTSTEVNAYLVYSVAFRYLFAKMQQDLRLDTEDVSCLVTELESYINNRKE